MLSFLWSVLVDRKPKPVHFHGLEKSAFQLRVEAQLNQCCLCGGSGHNSNTCPWSKE